MNETDFIKTLAGMRKWLSRQAHNLKVVGSNPTPALFVSKFFFIWKHSKTIFYLEPNSSLKSFAFKITIFVKYKNPSKLVVTKKYIYQLKQKK